MKVLLILAIFASVASVILCGISNRESESEEGRVPVVGGEQLLNPQDIGEDTQQAIMDYVAQQLQGGSDLSIPENKAYLFNLTYWLTQNRPTNTTALTFVPLITLLSGALG